MKYEIQYNYNFNIVVLNIKKSCYILKNRAICTIELISSVVC